MTMRYIILILLLAFPYSATAQTAVAEPTVDAVQEQSIPTDERQWWQVELIVFRNQNPNAFYEERWPTEHLATTILDDTPSLNELLGYWQRPEPIIEESLDGDSNVIESEDTAKLNLQEANLEIEQDITDEQAPPEPSIFEKIPKELRLLQKDRDHLYWNRNFEVLFYDAWRHPLESEQEPITYSFFSDPLTADMSSGLRVTPVSPMDTNGTQEAINSAAEINAKQLLLPPSAAADDIMIDELGGTLEKAFINADNYAIAGTITFSLRRFLHVQTDLWHAFKMPDNFLNSDVEKESEWHYTPLHHSRRLRSGEIHYLDHPLIGIMISVTPYEVPLSDEQAAEKTNSSASAN